MESLSDKIKRKPWLGWVIFLSTMVIVFLLGLLASSIVERRNEAVFTNAPKHPMDPLEPRNHVWAKNYPREYETYAQMADTSFRSKYNGSATIDLLREYPELVILWAGYAFSKDYRAPRGHFYAVQDIRETLRTGAPKGPHDGPQSSTCWTCKSPDVPRIMKEIGAEAFYKGKWAERGAEVVNPIGCVDCHDGQTMQLRISRPALVEAFQRQGKDVTKASHQEMRSLVCAQCHVEYYFKGDGKYLTFPWDKGMGVEAVEKYYDDYQFSDWTHELSKAPMVKAQHPDYEIYTLGIHAQRGVSCADCHMPYRSEGGQKFTDHKIQSPLNNIANSCQVCHRESEEELIRNVYERQDKVYGQRKVLKDILVKAHVEAKYAWDHGATEAQMKDILLDIRHAQWRWDYSEASNGAAFHAPLEVMRIVASATAKAQDARIKLATLIAKLGVKDPIPYPDYSTKEKAQAYLKLPMDQLRKEKAVFLNTVVPKWIEEAKVREAKYDIKYQKMRME